MELLTAGAFAKQCGTTKATLRWYRKMGIFEPFKIGSNGYAYYVSGQVVAFAIIRELQNLGCSLAQIKAYNNYGDLISIDSFLEEQIIRLDQRIDALIKQREFLDRIRNTQPVLFEQWGEHPSDGDWQIRHREQECYLVMNAPIYDTSAYQQRLIAFQQLCYEIGLGFNVPIAIFFEEKSLANRKFVEGYCVGTKVDDLLAIQEKITHSDMPSVEAPRLVFREAGDYFTYLATLLIETHDFNESTVSEAAPSSNPMIDGQKAALDFALREGCTTRMGLLETLLAALPKENGRMHLFFEISIAAF